MTCFLPFKVSPDETLHLAIAHRLAQAEIASAPPQGINHSTAQGEMLRPSPPRSGVSSEDKAPEPMSHAHCATKAFPAISNISAL